MCVLLFLPPACLISILKASFCLCSLSSSPSYVCPLLSHNDIWSLLRAMLLLVATREAVVTVT